MTQSAKAKMPLSPHFLTTDATKTQLLRAMAVNQTAWLSRNALASGGEIRRENGATWIFTPGPQGEVAITFPQIPEATVSDQLDAILAYARQRTERQVGCWALLPKRPRDLGARLAARGFEWGWQPHWMALELPKMRTDFAAPEGLHIALDELSEWEVEELPYYRRENAALLQAHSRAKPRRIWHFGAWLEGKVVGHCVLNLTTGRLGVAGIYDMGVVPSARNRGVGKAVMRTVCRFAEELGCRYATLNATGEGERIYRQLGFESLGVGRTWWMNARVLAAPPPTPEQLTFAEAVGRGDLKTLDSLQVWLLPEDLNAPLLCGMTPIELAVRAGKPSGVSWLVGKGATLDILPAWDLGWKDRAARLLADNPALANRRFGDWQITPLHEAIARGDVELTRLLLSAWPDIEIQDTQFHSTPLGWARHFRREESIALLEAYQAARSHTESTD